MVDNIKRLCKKYGISIHKLEMDCEFANGTISKWETSIPGIKSVEKIADYFNVPIDLIIGRLTFETEKRTPKEQELDDIVVTLNEDAIDMLIVMAKGLALQKQYKKFPNLKGDKDSNDKCINEVG